MTADFVKQEAIIERLEATGDAVFSLANQKLSKSDAADISKVTLTKDFTELPADQRAVTSFCVSAARNEIWVGNDKGQIFVLDTTNLNLFSLDKEVKTCYGHPVQSMAASADGKYVAVGDTKGYVTVFNTETRE